MTLPSLLVVSGPPGTGKTTLAHVLARAVGCPAICRDEIKEGMVHTMPSFKPSPNDPLSLRTFTTFFAVLDLLIASEVTLVAEAAFQDHLWRPALERFAGRADIRVLHCRVAPEVAHERLRRRLEQNGAARSAHADLALIERQKAGERTSSMFVPLALDVPTLQVDTTDGYRPRLDELVAFACPQHI